MLFLCHHTENYCLHHFVLKVCRTSAICVDRNRIFANRLHVTIEYTFDITVCNVERLNVSRFVTGVHMFQPRYYSSWLKLLIFDNYGFCLLGSPKHPMVSVYLFVFYFTIRPY